MSNARFVVRRAIKDDIVVMLRLWREMMDFHAAADSRFRPKSSPEGERAWERYVQDHAWTDEGWCVFVAEMDGRVVGLSVSVLRDPYPVFEPGRFGEVLDMVVSRDARRLGVGQALFTALEGWFRERGADHVELQVAHRNATSQAFWRSVGCTDYMDTLRCELEAE